MPVEFKADGMPVLDKSAELMAIVTTNRRVIRSSNVEWVAWPCDGKPLMLVKFRGSETVYGYIGVSRQRAVAAANSPSTGKYINEKIKPNFKAVKIR